MKDSGYDSNSEVIPHRATGYVYLKDKNRFENAGFIHMSIPQGAGALYSTTEDLLKWEQGLFGGNGYPVIQYEKTGLTLEFTPQVFPDLDVQVKMNIKSNDVTTTTATIWRRRVMRQAQTTLRCLCPASIFVFCLLKF